MSRRKKSTEALPGLSRRTLLLAGAGLAVMGAFAFVGHKSRGTQVSFSDAQRKPELRQAYLDARKELWARPYVRNVVYFNEMPTTLPPGTHAEMWEYKPEYTGKRLAYDVRVYPNAFTYYVYREEDLLSTLIDHEIEGHGPILHAGFDGFSLDDFLIAPKTYSAMLAPVIELFAYNNQIAKARSRGISNAYGDSLVGGGFVREYSALFAYAETPFKDPAFVEKLQVRLFNPVALSAKAVSGEPLIVREDGHLLWRMKDGPRKHLPEALCEKFRR